MLMKISLFFELWVGVVVGTGHSAQVLNITDHRLLYNFQEMLLIMVMVAFVLRIAWKVNIN